MLIKEKVVSENTMRSITLYILMLLFSQTSLAGVKTTLFNNHDGLCDITVTHDSTPESPTGELIFRCFGYSTEIYLPCTPDKKDTQIAMTVAMWKLKGKKLKPISRIFIGNLLHIDWLHDHLATHPPIKGNVTREYHDSLFNSDAFLYEKLAPFQSALKKFNLKIKKVRCEKIVFNKTGKPVDATCWLEL